MLGNLAKDPHRNSGDCVNCSFSWHVKYKAKYIYLHWEFHLLYLTLK